MRLRMIVLAACLNAMSATWAQGADSSLKVGIIDTYGLDQVSPQQVRGALVIAVGDKMTMSDQRPPALVESERRLTLLPNVVAAHISRVCCDHGRIILFVGIQERGAPVLQLRTSPTGTVSLKPDVVAAVDRVQQALIAAIRRGSTSEDDSRGHALSKDDKDLRAAQEQLIVYANRDTANLRQVLRESADAGQRASAAEVLAYADDKQSVVDDLIHATTDPDSDVRNNAVRALGVMTMMTPSQGHPVPKIPPGPFIAYLKSFVWTDRNKALMVLMGITAHRDAGLLATLRTQALAPLVEMARWQSPGHALPAFMILGRIAGLSDADTFAAWSRGDRESVIKAAAAVH